MSKKFVVPGVIVVAIVAAGFGIGRLFSPPPLIRGEGTVQAKTNPELAAAVLRAKKELPRFIEALKKGGGEFAVSAKFETPQGPEHIWVGVSSFEDGSFFGNFAAEPKLLEGRSNGDAVEVKEAQVSDWTFRVDGKVEGGFTSRVLAGKGD